MPMICKHFIDMEHPALTTQKLQANEPVKADKPLNIPIPFHYVSVQFSSFDSIQFSYSYSWHTLTQIVCNVSSYFRFCIFAILDLSINKVEC